MDGASWPLQFRIRMRIERPIARRVDSSPESSLHARKGITSFCPASPGSQFAANASWGAMTRYQAAYSHSCTRIIAEFKPPPLDCGTSRPLTLTSTTGKCRATGHIVSGLFGVSTTTHHNSCRARAVSTRGGLCAVGHRISALGHGRCRRKPGFATDSAGRAGDLDNRSRSIALRLGIATNGTASEHSRGFFARGSLIPRRPQ